MFALASPKRNMVYYSYKLSAIPCIVKKSACKDYIPCPVGKLTEDLYLFAGRLVYKGKLFLTLRDQPADIRKRYLVALADAVIIGLINKGKRKDACIDKVCSVYTRKALYNNSLDAEIQRSKSSMLTGTALTVVYAADNDGAAQRLCSFGEVLVTNGEAVL